MYTDFKYGSFAFFLNSLVNFLAGLLYHLLDLRGMDTSVHNEFLKCDPCDFSSYGIKSSIFSFSFMYDE